MRRRLSLWMLLSVGIHAGVVVAALALIGLVTAPPMLFVDLVHGLLAADSPGPAGRRDGGDGARTPGRAPSGGPATPPAPWTSRRAPPVAPAPTPERRAPEPTAPPVAPPAEIVRPAEPAQPPPPPAPVVSESAPVAEPARPTEPATGAPRSTESSSPSTVVGGSPSGGGVVSGSASPGPTAGGGSSSGSLAPGAGSTSGGRSIGEGISASGGTGGGTGGPLTLAVPGEGGGEAAEYAAYLALVRRRIHELLTYPSVARHRGLSGTVHIEVEIAPTGAVGRVSLAASSSHRVLDDAALDAARGVRRVPFPPDVRPRPLRVRLPVVFDLR
jgi:periplasmic protein TonB